MYDIVNLNSLLDRREIPGFPGYWICRDGEVYSTLAMALKKLPEGMACRMVRSNNKYPKVHLEGPCGRKTKTIHVLLLETFIGPRPEGMECRHLDGNKKNYSLSNLQWGTKDENGQDRIAHGHQIRGTRVPSAKLNDDQVKQIIICVANGETCRAVGDKYGVSAATVSRIANKKIWSHIIVNPELKLEVSTNGNTSSTTENAATGNEWPAVAAVESASAATA